MTAPPHPLDWTEDGQARSALYDDVFFSQADGLAEAIHVFLGGNRLSERFAQLDAGETFTIGELGFGSGLNMLAAMNLWQNQAPRKARLHLVSFEKHLLPAHAIEKMLKPWPHLFARAEPILKGVTAERSGDLAIGFPDDDSIRLTVLLGDAAERMADMPAPANAWFLDGFSPAKNPDLWSAELMAALAKQTAPGGTFATYTAAGWVRRNLEAAGFRVEKRRGFGTKREMMVGRLPEDAPESIES